MHVISTTKNPWDTENFDFPDEDSCIQRNQPNISATKVKLSQKNHSTYNVKLHFSNNQHKNLQNSSTITQNNIIYINNIDSSNINEKTNIIINNIFQDTKRKSMIEGTLKYVQIEKEKLDSLPKREKDELKSNLKNKSPSSFNRNYSKKVSFNDQLIIVYFEEKPLKESNFSINNNSIKKKKNSCKNCGWF